MQGGAYGKIPSGPQGPRAEHLQSCSLFEKGSLLGKASWSMPGASRIRRSPSQVMDTSTRRGSCRAVTMCPSSLITSQNLPRNKHEHAQKSLFDPLRDFPLAFISSNPLPAQTQDPAIFFQTITPI